MVRCVPDVVDDTIYQAAEITYVVKGDQEKKEILVPGMAVFFRMPAGDLEAGKIMSLDVFIDPSPLVERMKEVEALNRE